jgi:hypothetical protein
MKIQKIFPLSRGGWRTTEWQVYESEWNATGVLDQQDTATIAKIISRIQDKMSTINPKTNVLIDKNSDVPRAKLKEFLADNKANKVTLLSKADIVFVKRDTVKYLQSLETQTFQVVPSAEMNKIRKTTNTFYLRSTSSNDQEYFDLEKKCTTLTGQVVSSYRNTKLTESIEFILALDSSKATLVYDDCLTVSMNKDGIDLDEDVYDTLRSMLIAKDEDTFKLGIEMISNVNLNEENVFKISLLMNYCYTHTSRFSAMSRYNSKNFKALLNYLEINKIKWNQNWEVYGMSMWAKFGHTNYASSIKKYIVDNLNARFSKLSGGENSEIVDVVFK